KKLMATLLSPAIAGVARARAIVSTSTTFRREGGLLHAAFTQPPSPINPRRFHCAVGFLETRPSPGERKRLHETEAFHGFNHAFLDPQPAVLNPAERRILDAKTGDFVDVHRATAKAFYAFDGLVERARHDA